jgi:hypothetical protein
MLRKVLILLVAVLGVLAVSIGALGNTGTAEIGSPSRTFLPLVHNGPPPENIADARDLPIWVGEFVHAYGGKVTIDGMGMDASQLTTKIRRNGDEFIEVKPSAGVLTSFLMVNGIPLAMRAGQRWQEATMATLGEINGVEFECSLRLDDRKYEEFSRISEKALGHNTVLVLTTNLDVTAVFGDFVESDWQNILDNWASIREDFSSGAVPSGYPYKWERGLEALQPDVARAFGGNPQLRSRLWH